MAWKSVSKRLVILFICGGILVGILTLGSSFYNPYDTDFHVESGYMDLTNCDFNQGNIRLDGEWEFYWSKFLSHEHIESQQPDLMTLVPSAWNTYSIDGQRLPGRGYGTYRVRVATDIEPGSMLSLQIRTFSSAYALYIDEEQIAANGLVSANPSIYKPEYRPQIVDFTIPDSEFDIIVHVANHHHARGGFWFSIILGPTEGVANLNTMFTNRQVLFTGALVIISFSYLCIFALRRKAKEYLYFALLFLSLILLLDSTNQFLITRIFPQLGFRWLLFLWYGSVAWTVALLALVTETLFPLPWTKKVAKGIIFYTVIVTYFYGVLPVSWYTHLLTLFNVIGLVILFFILYLSIHAVRSRVDGSLLYAFGFITGVVVFIHDTLFSNNFLVGKNVELAYISIGIMLFSQAVVLAIRYTRAFNENSILLDKLQLADQQREEFMINTSHQIRNPITAITALTDEILSAQGQLSASQEQNLAQIKMMGFRATNLVNDILDYSILKRGDVSLNIEPVSLKTVTDNLVQIFRRARAGVREIDNLLPSNLPPVQADENRLYQIMYNLVDYTTSLPGAVTISTEVKDGYVAVQITNTQGEFSQKELGEIFSSTKDTNEPDLRLPITKHLVHLLGGTIEAQGTNPGLQLSFTLPISEAAKEVNTSTISLFQDLSIPLLGYIKIPCEGPHVLIVDDNLNTLNATARILNHSGFAVTATMDGNNALERVKADASIAAVLLDAMLPGFSGYDVCREIRKLKSAFELPILILTARSVTRDIGLGFEVGANDSLIKPFERDELLARVRTLVNLKESVDKAIKSEIAFLQAQIRPHFLFNALGVISALTLTTPQKARELIFNLSSFLRNSFDFSVSEEMVPLGRELELVEAYVSLEKARFGSRLDFMIQIDDLDILIPRLVLQPLVENAILHGVLKKPQEGQVLVKAEERQGEIIFSVTDNGIGMDQDQVEMLLAKTGNKGVGLTNINKRLLRYYNSGLRVVSKPNLGTTVSFSIPSANSKGR